eukprot:12258862-Alexandrium_andersonii.AAC.1
MCAFCPPTLPGGWPVGRWPSCACLATAAIAGTGASCTGKGGGLRHAFSGTWRCGVFGVWSPCVCVCVRPPARSGGWPVGRWPTGACSAAG